MYSTNQNSFNNYGVFSKTSELSQNMFKRTRGHPFTHKMPFKNSTILLLIGEGSPSLEMDVTDIDLFGNVAI